jgi:hypothetical protein
MSLSNFQKAGKYDGPTEFKNAMMSSGRTEK